MSETQTPYDFKKYLPCAFDGFDEKGNPRKQTYRGKSFLNFAKEELNLVKSITNYPLCPKNKQFYFNRIEQSLKDQEPHRHSLREIFMMVRSYDIQLTEFVENCLVKLDEKSQDYSNNGEKYHTFNYTADFNNIPVVLSINVIIGVKLGRISAIINREKVINESLVDSLIDLCGYVLLIEGFKRGLQ